METWRDGFHPTQRQRFGGRATVATPGSRCVRVCHRRAASSPCSVKQWLVTSVIRPASISAQIVVRYSQAWMKEKIGRKSHATCQRYLLSKHSNEANGV